jgi:hypothetical protein
MLVLWAGTLEAEWIEDGTPICTEQYAQQYMQIIEDGHGGAILVWADYRTPTPPYLYHDIYAQRIDKRGNELWAAGGIPICTDTLSQYMPQIVPDGYGNFIIAWTDVRTGFSDIYAQRIDIDGNALWTEGGIAVCSATNNQDYLRMIPAEGGGAIIAWQDWRSGSNWDIYAQKIDTSGTALWTPNGVGACTHASSQDDLEIATNGNGGVYLVWEDTRNGNYDIYLNMITSAGGIYCTSDGYPVCTNVNSQFDPAIVPDGNGDVVIIWVDNRNGNNDIFAQKMSGCYNSWTADGIAVCTAANTQNYPILVPYGDYTYIAAWRDTRGGTDADLYAQKIGFFGNMLWTADGKPICTAFRDQYINDAKEDAAGNLVFTWMDLRNLYHDIYVQKVDPDGEPIWTASGVALCEAPDYQTYPVLAADDEGGMIVAWRDQRNSSTSGEDIFAQRIDGYGVWGYPAPAITAIEDVPNDQGGSVTVGWDPSPLDCFPYTVISHYSIWRNLEASLATVLFDSGIKNTPLSAVGADFEGTAYRFVVTSLGIYGWEWIGNIDAHRLDAYAYTAATLFDSTDADDGMHHFFVASHSDDPYVYWDSEPDSGYSVDNLAPCAPLGVAAEQQYDPEGLLIHWNPNTEADLGGYRIYRGTEEEFVPDPEVNLLAATCDTAVTDGEWRWDDRYYYKLCAVDIHGNESGYVLVSTTEVTGDETPQVNFLSQNYPNPFNPSTSIRFGLRAAADVDLRIYDAAGRLVRVLVGEHREAGAYEEIWNGCDSAGREVASGIYFYRLEAGAFVQTRKMVLLR